MTRTFRSASWAVLAFLPASMAFAAPAGQISETTGFVTVGAPQQSPTSAKKGSGVEVGQVITTGANGQAVIKFQDGQVVALQSKSVFRVNDYQFNQAAPEKGQSFLALLQGGARIVTGLIGTNNRGGWKLALPTATAEIRGTDFLALIRETSSYFKVKAGSISSTNGGGTAVFEVGQNAVADNPTVLTRVVSDADLPAGLFGELEQMSLSGSLSGPSSGAAGAAGPMVGPVPAWAIVVGIGAAMVGATISDDNATTTHH